MIDICEQQADNPRFMFELNQPPRDMAPNIIVTSIQSFEQNCDNKHLKMSEGKSHVPESADEEEHKSHNSIFVKSPLSSQEQDAEQMMVQAVVMIESESSKHSSKRDDHDYNASIHVIQSSTEGSPAAQIMETPSMPRAGLAVHETIQTLETEVKRGFYSTSQDGVQTMIE